eukprot:TRINITY_DN58812_c0_g1_i1.p1 TRINITY_DN58812_c0_g1~~TRINITY_DN58812_c0_g1_i1.p1  ORF type:complete len:100 (-),score=1.22 TRINITY_DN58812_c0_g1_i1:22-321(-)
MLENFLIVPNLTHNPGFTFGGVTQCMCRVGLFGRNRGERMIASGFRWSQSHENRLGQCNLKHADGYEMRMKKIVDSLDSMLYCRTIVINWRLFESLIEK